MIAAFLAGVGCAALFHRGMVRMIANADTSADSGRPCPACGGDIWARRNPDGTRGCTACGKTGTFERYLSRSRPGLHY
jgi:hypothetical protein